MASLELVELRNRKLHNIVILYVSYDLVFYGIVLNEIVSYDIVYDLLWYDIPSYDMNLKLVDDIVSKWYCMIWFASFDIN